MQPVCFADIERKRGLIGVGCDAEVDGRVRVERYVVGAWFELRVECAGATDTCQCLFKDV